MRIRLIPRSLPVIRPKILQSKVEKLEKVLSDKNTNTINSLREDESEIQAKLTDALRHLAEHEGGETSSKCLRESSRESFSRSWCDRSQSRDLSRSLRGCRPQRVNYSVYHSGGSDYGGGGGGSFISKALGRSGC